MLSETLIILPSTRKDILLDWFKDYFFPLWHEYLLHINQSEPFAQNICAGNKEQSCRGWCGCMARDHDSCPMKEIKIKRQRSLQRKAMTKRNRKQTLAAWNVSCFYVWGLVASLTLKWAGIQHVTWHLTLFLSLPVNFLWVTQSQVSATCNLKTLQ